MKIIVERAKRNDIVVKKSANAVFLKVPIATSNAEISRCLIENKQWLKGKCYNTHVASEPIKNTQNSNTVSQSITSSTSNFDTYTIEKFLDAFQFLIDGNVYTLVCSEKYNGNDNCIVLPNVTISNFESRKEGIKRYISSHARQYAKQRVASIGNSLKVCASNIKLTYIKGEQWCKSSKTNGELVIDYRTVQLPLTLQKYIYYQAFSLSFGAFCIDCYTKSQQNYFNEKCKQYHFIKLLC